MFRDFFNSVFRVHDIGRAQRYSDTTNNQHHRMSLLFLLTFLKQGRKCLNETQYMMNT